MARPRLHNEDSILDAAEEIVVGGGTRAVTMRALSASTGASTGTLYHAFGSRTELLGRMWLRAAGLYMDRLEALVEEALSRSADDGVEATIAAARTLAVLRKERPRTARLLISYRHQDLLGDDVAPELATELGALDGRLLAAIRHLARLLWGKRDRASLDTVAVCIVDLPTALLAGGGERRQVDSEALLAAAVRAVLAQGRSSETRRTRRL